MTIRMTTREELDKEMIISGATLFAVYADVYPES
jgi:hypothetical protein